MQKIHIKLESNQKVYFTSDLHFGHRNVIKFCNRPFIDEKEMEVKLIENWNNTVGDNDIIFSLGDMFWFNDSHKIKKVLSQLNGKDIYIIPGNHDDFTHYYRVDDPRIHLCADIVCLYLTDDVIHEMWLSHYPVMTWPHRENKTFQLFGHIHSCKNRHEGVDQDLPLHWNQADVGCDYWNYHPVSFDDIYIKLFTSYINSN